VEEGVREVSENGAREEERRADEFVKLCFEVFKHLTTLSTAGALVVLAVYREIGVVEWLLGLTLVLFGVSILASVVSMMLCTTYYASSAFSPSEPVLGWLMFAAAGSFLTGAESFMLLLTEWPRWLNFILPPVVLIALSWLVKTPPPFLLRGGRDE
jgi:hypothetical protein